MMHWYTAPFVIPFFNWQWEKINRWKAIAFFQEAFFFTSCCVVGVFTSHPVEHKHSEHHVIGCHFEPHHQQVIAVSRGNM